jgi:Short C-terminal domain
VTVGKITAACWTFFVIMSVAFLPLGFGIMQLHAVPMTARVVLAIIVAGGLWWGPFGYAMYLSIAVMRNGDRRLLARGVRGTAEVLSAKRTRTVIQEGEFAWEAPRVYKYRLRVSIPGRAPYETDCSICAAGISEGSTVNVAVSPHNRHRVTIDVGQDGKGGARVPRPVAVQGTAAHRGPGHGALGHGVPVHGVPATMADLGRGAYPPGQVAAEAQRIGLLTQLGQLHQQGILTDSEFAAQKAQILGG